MAVEPGLVTCAGVFSPVLATRRLDLTPAGRVARTLSAWSVNGRAAAALTALLAALTHRPRTAIGSAGVPLLVAPLLPRKGTVSVTARPSPATVPPSPAGSPPNR